MLLQEVCKFACLLHNPSTADYRKWLAPGACFDLGCRCGPKAVGGEGVVGAIEEGMAAVSCHGIAGSWVAFFSRCRRYRCRQDCVLYDLSALSLLPRADPVVSLVLSSARPTIGAPQVHSVFVRGRRVVTVIRTSIPRTWPALLNLHRKFRAGTGRRPRHGRQHGAGCGGQLADRRVLPGG